jgi:hypothetical protein
VTNAALLKKVDELSARVAALEADNTCLREENARLREENRLLRQKLEADPPPIASGAPTPLYANSCRVKSVLSSVLMPKRVLAWINAR